MAENSKVAILVLARIQIITKILLLVYQLMLGETPGVSHVLITARNVLLNQNLNAMLTNV